MKSPWNSRAYFFVNSIRDNLASYFLSFFITTEATIEITRRKEITINEISTES